MSRIDELIKELCPEGVAFLPLSQVTKLGAGDRVTKADMTNTGRFPAYGAGTIPTGRLDRWNRKHSVLISRAGAGAGYVNFVETEFWATDVCFVAEQKPDGPLIRFVYFWLKSNQPELMRHTYGGSMPKIDKIYLWRHPVPVPPPEVQREIVSILDKFTQLEAELEAELEARRTQYEVTRDRLLDFSGDLSAHPMREKIRELCPEEIPWRALGELGVFIRGGSIKKDQLLQSGLPAIHYGEIYTTFGASTTQAKSFVPEELFESQPKGKYGDLLITLSDVTPNNVGMATTWLGDTDVALGGDILAFRHSMDPKFLSYVFRTHNFQAQKRLIVTGGTVRHVSASGLSKLKVPAPPLEIQKEIVAILDKLDALVNDTVYGLPAEIEGRRKQSEYYRNKLLTFKELDAA